MRCGKAIAAAAMISALLLMTACGEQDQSPKAEEQKIYSGNDGTTTSRRLTAEEKEAILSGEAFASTTEIVCPVRAC